MAEAARPPRRGRALVAGAALLVALVLLLSLGTWQVTRLHWKEALLVQMTERRAMPPATLGEIEAMAARGEDIEYRPLRVEGVFENDRERHFFATWQGRSGYNIYTPLQLADGRHLFVNRGFVPFDRKEPETREEGRLAGERTVVGLARARLAEKPSSLVPDNDLAKNIFYWKDLDAMALSTGIDGGRLVPFFIDADDTPNPGGLPIGGVTPLDLPNNHLQYAVTWYGLALALVAVSGAYLWRRKR